MLVGLGPRLTYPNRKAAIDDLLVQIKQSFLIDLMPSPAKKVADIGMNQFGNVRFGEGNIVIGYNASGVPATMTVTGTDEDMAVLSSPFIDHVRIIETKDAVKAQKLAEVFEAAFGVALHLDEPQRRRIRRAARQVPTRRDGPPSFVRVRHTGGASRTDATGGDGRSKVDHGP